MFNAILAGKNFGGRWSMLPLTPAQIATIQQNIKTLFRFLQQARTLGRNSLGGTLRSGGNSWKCQRGEPFEQLGKALAPAIAQSQAQYGVADGEPLHRDRVARSECSWRDGP